MVNPTMNRVMLASVGIISALVVSTSAQDLGLPSNQCYGISRGKHFVIGFTDNTNERSYTRKLFLLVVAFSNQRTAVTISSKFKVDGSPYQESFTIEAGGFKRTTVPVELMLDGTERSLKAIDISASSDVSAYGLMYQDFTTDGFLGIPTNNLGNQYVVITPAPGGLPAHFAVIGTEDSTTVRVSLRGSATFEGITHNTGDILTFMVNQLEAVQIQGIDSNQDFTGSIIQSDKPISVFSGKECVNHMDSACDTVTEQLVPVKSWGQKHIYTASRSTDSNIYRIVAYFSGTNITIPGFADQVLEPGEFWEGRLSGSGVASSSKPSLMMQHLATINGNVVDPSFIQVPAEENFGFLFGFTTPPHSGGDSGGYFNFISIIVKTHSRQTVHMNGQPINGTDVEESVVPGTDYTSLTIQLPKGEGVYFVEQTAPRMSPLSVIVYGYESYETYGYAAGLSLPTNEQLLSSSPYYLREMGGEVFTITVPCLESNSVVGDQNAICKFTTGFGDVLVSGDRVDFYTVACVTPTFYKAGISSVYVSLDNGLTFPYSGVVYIASEEDLPPLVEVHQIKSEDRGGVIDLTLDDPIIISWDPVSVGEDTMYLDLVMQEAALNADGNPVLMEGVAIKTRVPNSGTLTINPADITTERSELLLSAFYLRPILSDTARNRRANFFVKLGKRIYSGIRRVKNYLVNLPCTVFEGTLMKTPSGTGPCPCTSGQAQADALNFALSNELIEIFHPGAENCYRSTSSSASGSGQQCCYGADGNILVGPPGGGTEDTFSPGDNFWKHQWYDVLPAIGCCWFSDNCDTYYKFRPSDDCSEYVPPRPAGGTGDPHITSLDGSTFTFNGAGEFLMLSSLLHNLTFQARMERYRDTQASVYTAFVMKSNDSSVIQVQISRQNVTSIILVDGEPLRLDSPIRIHHLKGVQINLGPDLTEIRITFTAGFGLIVAVNAEVMSFIAQLDAKFQGRVKGLLGNFNGETEDDLQFPNGTTLKPRSSLGEIHELGMQWLITPEDSIFSYIPPYDYNSYHFPEFSPILEVPKLDSVSQEIKDLCGDSIECVFDAVTTGSLAFANETLLVTSIISNFQKTAFKIISCGFPGKLGNATVIGSVYLINSTVEVACDGGFILEGSARLVCQADGQWSSDLPRCTKPRTDSKEDGLSTIAYVGIALGAVGVVLVIVVILYFTWRKM